VRLAVDQEYLLEVTTRTIVLADSIGLAALAGEIGLIGVAASSLEIPTWGWIVAYGILAVVALIVWHGKKWPKETREVLKAVFGSFLLGGAFFAIDLTLGHFLHPDLPLIQAAEHSGGPFGFGLTVLVCPVMTVVVLAGYFRAIFLDSESLLEDR
jgi:uncharacterized membrane protein YkvI